MSKAGEARAACLPVKLRISRIRDSEALDDVVNVDPELHQSEGNNRQNQEYDEGDCPLGGANSSDGLIEDRGLEVRILLTNLVARILALD